MNMKSLRETVDELTEKVMSLEDEIDALHYELKQVQEENQGLKKNSSDLVNVITRQTRDNRALIDANQELREKIGTLNDKILSMTGRKVMNKL